MKRCGNCENCMMSCAGIDAPCLEMKDSLYSQIVAWVMWMVIISISVMCRFFSWLIFGNAASVHKEDSPARRLFNFALFIVCCVAGLLAIIVLLINQWQALK